MGIESLCGEICRWLFRTLCGTVRQRLQDLQSAMDDPKVKAILCSRGGYGAVHLVDKIDFTAFREHPKWLLGFSDITALHNLFQKNGYASLHSLMARHLSVEPEEDPCVAYLKDILFGNLPVYTCEKHKLNRQGTAEGILRGGNMAVAYGLRGTPYDIPAEGTILFLEDVSERPHAIERMMYNLKLGGVLKNSPDSLSVNLPSMKKIVRWVRSCIPLWPTW